MERAKNIAKYLLYLDKNEEVFLNKIINSNNRNCYEGNVRLNKYLHIMQIVYIAMTGNKLFDDDISAFDNGVVVTSIVNNYSYLKSKKESSIIADDSIKTFVKKMFTILKYAPLEDLAQIFHQDGERKDQLVDVNGQKEKYKIICADFIDILNNI